jgi:group I intron endonuclease
MARLQLFFSIIELSMGYLHLAEIQDIVRKELRFKSGIYGFICKTNNKLYIGSSIDLSSRFNNHIKGLQSNILLQRAINKYELQDFIFIVFEYCEPEELLSREQFYLDELRPDFNILKVAGSSLGFTLTLEAKAKLRDANLGEKNPNYGKTGYTPSAETRAKMRQANLGKILSAETRAKISAAQGTAILVYSKEYIIVNTFSSTREAAKYFNCSHPTITNYITTGKLFQKQWFLSYK